MLDNESSSVVTIITNDTSYNLENILSVTVFPLQNNSISNIYVTGAVKEPGYYKLEDYETLESLITDLDFNDVYPWLAVLEQFDEDNMVKSSILFSLKDPTTYESIKLLPNSRVNFADINERTFYVEDLTRRKIADYDLQINHKQGSYALPVYGKYSVLSFINLLGLDMSDVEIEATYISPLESLVINGDYREMEFNAKKYNTITFRSPVNDLIKVTITGHIDYPGTYTLESDTTIQDLYELIGKFKKEAFIDGIIFTRQSVRERQLKAINKSKQDLNEALLVSTQKRGSNW